MTGNYEYDDSDWLREAYEADRHRPGPDPIPTGDPVLDSMDEICNLARRVLQFVVIEWLTGTPHVSPDVVVAEFAGGSYSEEDVRLAIDHIHRASLALS